MNPSNQENDNTASTEKPPRSRTIGARTAQNWLKKLGLEWKTVRKGVYIDGHGRDDVREYQGKVFIPQWYSFQPRFILFNEGGTWSIPNTLPEGEKPLVPVTHESA